MLLDMSTNQWIMSFSFACTMAFLCGWIADKIMGYSGFGVIGNWLLMLVGCYAGLYVYNEFGYRFEWYPMMALGVAFGAGTFMLITLAGIKAATNT